MVRKSLKSFKGYVLDNIAFKKYSDNLLLTFKDPKNPNKVRYLTVDYNNLFDVDGNRLSISGILEARE